MATKKTAAKKTASKKSATKYTAPTMDAVSTIGKKAAAANEPTMEPMQQNGGGLLVWNNNTRIVQTWSKAENNNAWLNITGLGWRKIKESNSQALLALAMIGAHGRDKNSLVNVRTEADNKIYELYVW